MNLGIVITLIVVFGYLSNWLNWRFLNYRLTRLLYYLGAFVHETSHALLCLLTGAKVSEFRFLTDQPHIIHGKSKLPIIGEPLIALAPIAGGLLFIYVINRYALGGYFTLLGFAGWSGWQGVLLETVKFLSQINILAWQSWVIVFLFLNAGAMLGPSFQDLKNIWPILILLFFAHNMFLEGLGLQVLVFILVNIAIQIFIISLYKILTFARN